MTVPELSTAATRHFIYGHFAETGAPPSIENCCAHFQVSKPTLRAQFEALARLKQLVMLGETDRILCAHPFSALVTTHRIEARGVSYWGPCAWDGLALHWTLDAPITLHSRCFDCFAPMQVKVSAGHAVSAGPDVHLRFSRPAREWWSAVFETCSTCLALVCPDCAPQSQARKGVEIVPIDVAVRIGRPIYAGKLNLDYARPPTAALEAAFAAEGLTSDFWKF